MIILWVILIVIGIIVLYAVVYSIAYNCATKGVDTDIDLSAPMKKLYEVIDGDDKTEYWRMLNFITKYEDLTKDSTIHDIDETWIKRFVNVCHWCGYQIVLHREGKKDIESPESEVFEEELLYEFSRENHVFDEKKMKDFKDKRMRREEELKQIKKKLNY